jgi:hypothetical protein
LLTCSATAILALFIFVKGIIASFISIDVAGSRAQRLPEYFPLVDKKKRCKGVSNSLFDCFDINGKQEAGIRDAFAGKQVFSACKKQLAAYSSCMTKANANQNLRLVRAPQAYLDELAE